MAAPHVAGAWAVLKQAKSTASVDEVLNALKTTGIPITDTRAGADNRVKPRIQVDQAVSWLMGGGDCAATTTVNATPERESWLDLLDEVRDRVLASSAEGRALIETYYRHSDEVSEQLRSSPRLIGRSRSDPLSPTLPHQGGGSKRISSLRYRSQRSQQGGLNAYDRTGTERPLVTACRSRSRCRGATDRLDWA